MSYYMPKTCEYSWKFGLDAGGRCPNETIGNDYLCIWHTDDKSEEDLPGNDFSGLTLREANLTHMNLSGYCFARCDLRGADFTGAVLRNADFQGANLTEAFLDYADMSNTRLTGAILSSLSMVNTRLAGSDFRKPESQLPHHFQKHYYFDNRFIVEEKLGQGSFGYVYKVREPWHSNAYAIKILNPQWYSDPKTLKRFLRQEVFLKQVAHRNLVQILEFCEGEGLHYMVMEHVEGTNLQQLLDSGEVPKWPLKRKVDIALQLSDALAQLATRDILHRDVKPTNIIIQDDYTVRLVDYELAKYLNLSALSQSQTPGTPRFWSPEHAEPLLLYCEQSDIFSYGIVLHILFTSEYPRSMSNKNTYFNWRAGEKEPLNPQKHDAKLPKEIADIIVRCLRTEISERPKNFQEVSTLLKKALTEKPAKPPEPKAPVVIQTGEETKYVSIPSKKIIMGTSQDEAEYLANFFGCLIDLFLNEIPQIEVRLPAYRIATTPVTNAEYARFCQATRRKPPKYWGRDTPPEELMNHPVVEVSFWDAFYYCKWAGLSLPTEPMWEYAARGDKRFNWAWGNQFTYDLCNCNEDCGGTSAVKSFPDGRSPYGLYDVTGNVWEWTLTNAKLYRAYRVAKGGSWVDNPAEIRTAARFELSPSIKLPFVGFRCVKMGN